MLDQVLRGQRQLKLSHTIVTIDSLDWETRTIAGVGEYHIRLASEKPGEPPSPTNAAAGKAVGLSFQLPEGDTRVHSVTVNGVAVPSVSPENDLENVSNFNLCYWSFPRSADSNALASIFGRVCENRRDLISFEEISKAHKSASLAQSFGLLVKIPSSAIRPDEHLISVVIRFSASSSPLFKVSPVSAAGSGAALPCLATLGPEPYFPIAQRLMILPSGTPVTSQPMEHARHRLTIRLADTAVAPDTQVVASGDKLGPNLFESSWINPRSAGLFVASNWASVEERGVCVAYAHASVIDKVKSTLSGGVVREIFQVLGPWFASPVQLLPQINICFLPLAVAKSFFVHGNTLVIDASVLHGDRDAERRIAARIVLAEAIATLWVQRAMPAFSEPWIPVGIAGMLTERFVEFHFGVNEYQIRLHQRRQRFHALVERGLDWLPLTVINNDQDAMLRLKAPLVMDCLRRSLVGDSDMRAAFHEIATVAGGKKGPWNSEAFFFQLTCSVGQHTEAGQAIPRFKDEWVKGVGVPLIHVGFSMLEKRRFAVNVTQRPLQKILIHDATPLCSSAAARSGGCACGSDFVCRKDEAQGGASFMRAHHVWPATARRRFWPGEVNVSVFRASSYFVPVAIKMEETGANQVLTVPYVTPRKHEQHLNRTARDDELVHGFVAVLDDRWLMAKIVVCQSPLMWCNMLQFSRSVVLEIAAIDALQHVRGSTLAQDALASALTAKQQETFWRVRLEAGRALIHQALGCQERESLHHVLAWLEEIVRSDVAKRDPKDLLAWLGLAEHLAHAKRSTDRRDQRTISDLFVKSLRAVERAIAVNPVAADWAVASNLLLASTVKFVALTAGSDFKTSPSFHAIDTRLRSDAYGPPLASPDAAVTEALLSAAPANGLPIVSAWPHMSDLKFIEKLAMHADRRMVRTAMRAYFSVIGGGPQCPPDSEGAWRIRFFWIEKLTDEIIKSPNMQTLQWLVDCWETLGERFRKDNAKSGIHAAVMRKDTCDALWKYLTFHALKLPASVRTHVQLLVHSLYLQAFGTGVPTPYKELMDHPRGEKGPMTFWMPFKEHERIYRRFVFRGATVRPEQPKSHQVKKPRLLITSAGSVPLPGAN